MFAKIPVGKKRLLSAEDTVRCISHPQYKETHVCSKTPTYINHNIMFLVDMTKLGDPTDVDSDDLGVWHNNRVDSLHFSVKVGKKEVAKVKKVPARSQSIKNNIYTLKRVYRIHGTDRSFRKVSASLIGEDAVIIEIFQCNMSTKSFTIIITTSCFLRSFWTSVPYCIDHLQIRWSGGTPCFSPTTQEQQKTETSCKDGN
jgi:hypothetical protein